MFTQVGQQSRNGGQRKNAYSAAKIIPLPQHKIKICIIINEMHVPNYLGRKKLDNEDEIQIILVKTGLSHSGNKGSLSDHLGHPAQGLSSSTAQDGVGIV